MDIFGDKGCDLSKIFVLSISEELSARTNAVFEQIIPILRNTLQVIDTAINKLIGFIFPFIFPHNDMYKSGN